MTEVDQAIRVFKQNLAELINTRSYNVTQEIFAEVKAITSGLDSVKMDNMFLNKSQQWNSQFNNEKLNQDKRGKQFFVFFVGQSVRHKMKCKINFIFNSKLF